MCVFVCKRCVRSVVWLAKIDTPTPPPHPGQMHTEQCRGGNEHIPSLFAQTLHHTGQATNSKHTSRHWRPNTTYLTPTPTSAEKTSLASESTSNDQIFLIMSYITNTQP